MNNLHPYDALTPDVILTAMQSIDLIPDGRILPLNSYENRVYQIGIEDAAPLIAKFYRPQRWSSAALHEEHGFALELAAAEIPVIAPQLRGSQSLFDHAGFTFAVYPRQGGQWPELGTRDEREWMGRFLGRIHAIGAKTDFQDRPVYSVETFGEKPAAYLLERDWVPAHLRDAYESLI